MIEKIKSFLNANEVEMFALLEKLVLLNSYSSNPDGVNEVGRVLDEVMKEMGFSTRRVSNGEYGDVLVAENKARASSGGGALLQGHMDTVFATDSGFEGFWHDGPHLRGPGVYDMKGGIVAGIYALKALSTHGLLADRPVAFLFNADEEVGSKLSRNTILEESAKSDFCLVLECGGLNGEVVTGRKGRMVFELKTHGTAIHAGDVREDKASSILEMAHQIIALEAMNDADAGTSVNVGTVEGGFGSNTVPALTTALVECRYTNEKAGDAAWERFQSLAANPTIPGTRCELTPGTRRPAMETNQAILGLYNIYKKVADELELEVKGTYRGGGSDGSIAAQTGIPVLDGLGPRGDHCHTPDEYIVAASMVERALLAAVSMMRAFEVYGVR